MKELHRWFIRHEREITDTTFDGDEDTTQQDVHRQHRADAAQERLTQLRSEHHVARNLRRFM